MRHPIRSRAVLDVTGSATELVFYFVEENVALVGWRKEITPQNNNNARTVPVVNDSQNKPRQLAATLPNFK